MFSKNNVGTLIKLLSNVESSIIILRVKYVGAENLLLVAYGVLATERGAEVPYSGVSIYTKHILPTEFNNAEKTTVELKGVFHVVSVSVAKIFHEIIAEIMAELESRVKNILTPPPNAGLELIHFDMIESFSLQNATAKIRVTIGAELLKYKEELNSFQAFYLGTKKLYSFFFLRLIQHTTKQSIYFSGEEYIALLPKAISNSVAKYMQALSESGILDVLLEDEPALRSRVENIQNKHLEYIRKVNQEVGFLKKIIIDSDNNEFLIKGLELSYVVFLLIGTPKNIPINLLTWVIDDLGDDVIKNRLKRLDLDLFLGQERVLFEGLVQDISDEDLMKKIDLGCYTNLYETKSEGVIRDFKIAVQKLVNKFNVKKNEDVGGDKKKSGWFLKSQKVKSVTPPKKELATFPLFPAFDVAEKELRIRELAREISIYYMSTQPEEFRADVVKKISGEVYAAIRQMQLLHIIWVSKGWVYVQSGTEDQIKEEFGKKIYNLIFKWPQIKEQSIRNRWNLIRDYEVVGYNDIFEIFKTSDINTVHKELDRLFIVKKLVVRKVGAFSQAQIGIDLEGEDSPDIIKMMKVLVEKLLRLKSPRVFKLKFILHRMIKKGKGYRVLKGDLVRNIDFLDDILFIYSSRFGLDIPNGHLIEQILTDLRELEVAGVLKRYLFNQQPVTSIPRKLDGQLSEGKQLLLQAIGAIVERYEG